MSVVLRKIFLLFLFVLIQHVESLSPPEIGRRDAISKAVAAVTATISLPSNAVDHSAGTDKNGVMGIEMETPIIHTIRQLENPPPTLSLPAPASIDIPRVGFSLYKTPIDKVERCAALALRSGVTHLDVATQYESNAEVGKAIRTYLQSGRTKLATEEKPELLEMLDASCKYETSRIQTKSKKRVSSWQGSME